MAPTKADDASPLVAMNTTSGPSKKRKSRKFKTIEIMDPSESNATASENFASNELLETNSSASNITRVMDDLMGKDPRLHIPPSVALAAQKNWYQSYTSTLFLIILIHVVFLHHWNTKRNKKQVLATYRQIVHRKQHHLAVTAILSHPPVADAVSIRPLAVEMGHAVETFGGDASSNLQTAAIACGRLLRPMTQGHLSGLPLVVYNSHVLWSCRALEPLLSVSSPDKSYSYACCLLSWATLVLCMELRISYQILDLMRNSLAAASSSSSLQPDFYPSDYASSPLAETRRFVLHRGMGTCTGLAAAVLWVFHHAFPYVPLEPLPLLSLGPIFSWTNQYFVSYWCSLMILTWLSWRIQPLTPILCGTVTGMLWSLGLTRFLGEVYWGRLLALWITVLCVLSLKASRQRRVDIPCVDYVSWDHRGRIRSEPAEGESEGNHEEQDDGDDEEEQDDDDDDDMEGSDDSSIVSDVESPSVGRRRRRPDRRLVDMEDDDDENSIVVRSNNSRGSNGSLISRRSNGRPR